MDHTVLIADNDELLLSLYGRFLTRRGYKVQTAMGGVECVAKLRSASPEILILDMEIPWGGGAGVLAALREKADVLRPFSIIVTGNVPVSTLKDASVFPVIRCVRKPYRLHTILEETLSDLGTFGHGPQDSWSNELLPVVQHLMPVRTSVGTHWHMGRA